MRASGHIRLAGLGEKIMRALFCLMVAVTACSEPVDQSQLEYEARLERLKATADPGRAAASNPNNAVLNEQIATVLNLNGLLCANVVSVRPLEVRPNHYEVTCVEYRGGSGEVRYIMDAAKGTAFKA